MSNPNEFKISFPWKKNTNKPIAKEINIKNFNGVNFVASLTISKSQKLGIKITANSTEKFSINSSFEVKISKKSVQKKYIDGCDFIFTNNDNSVTIYPGIYVDDIDSYLYKEENKYYIHAVFFIVLSLHDSDFEQEEETDETEKATKRHKKRADSDDYSNNQKYKKSKHKSKEKNKSSRKSKSEGLLSKKLEYDYSEEESKTDKNAKSCRRHDKYESDGNSKKTKKSDKNQNKDPKTVRRTKRSSSNLIRQKYDSYSESSDYDTEQTPDRSRKKHHNSTKRKVIKSNQKESKKSKSRSTYNDESESCEWSEYENESRHHKAKGKNKKNAKNKRRYDESSSYYYYSSSYYESDEDDRNDRKRTKSKNENTKEKNKSRSKRKEGDNKYEEDDKYDKGKNSHKSKNDEKKSQNQTNNYDRDKSSKQTSNKTDENKKENDQKSKTKSKTADKTDKNKKENDQTSKSTDKNKKGNEQALKSSDKNDKNKKENEQTSKTTNKNPTKDDGENKSPKKESQDNKSPQKEGQESTSPKKEDQQNKTTNKSGEKSKTPTEKDEEINTIPTKKTKDNDNKKETKDNEIDSNKQQQTNNTTIDPSKNNTSLLNKNNDNKNTNNHYNYNYNNNNTCPFIGLSNLGATCYMNSAIQVLFHTPLFRKNVLTYDTGITNINQSNARNNNQANKSKLILFNLQYLFYQMIECMKQKANNEHRRDYISTISLTNSFGWDQQDTSTQQDVHEFIINFFEVLDTGTSQNNNNNSTITNLFKGQNITTILNKRDESVIAHSFEDFYDFSLLVKGNKNIYDALDSFTEKDNLNSDSNSQQLIQVLFYSLPKVLNVHLRRFIYSPERYRTEKVNDYFSFPDELDMSPYIFKGYQKSTRRNPNDNDEISPYKGECKYSLYGVIVHQGKTSSSGHYFSYLKLNPYINNENYSFNPKDENWYLFDDSRVSKVTKEEAITMNFGRKDKYDNYSKYNCAYMLLYVRKDSINEVFNIRNSDIKMPRNFMNCINNNNNNSSTNTNTNNTNNTFNNSSNKIQSISNEFTNESTNATIGFTIITEDCIRMNCKFGKAGIDNRKLSKRINIPFDQFFSFKKSKSNGYFVSGGLYAAVSVFLKIDINRLRLWSVTSNYEICKLLKMADFEFKEYTATRDIEKLQEKFVTIINPRVIFVEVLPLDSSNVAEQDENSASIVTKLYTRETQCPMLYTGILPNISYTNTINTIVNQYYKKQLFEISCSLSKISKNVKSMINSLNFEVYYEKKRSNVKGDTDLIKLNLSKSLKDNKVPNGSIIIFNITQPYGVDEEMIIRWVEDLINNDKSMNKSIPDKNSESIYRYCEMILEECPASLADFCNLFTNTEIVDVYRYSDNAFIGKVELPAKLSIDDLSRFISFTFNLDEKNESKLIFFSDGPSLRPLKSWKVDSNAAIRSIYFESVPKDFNYSESWLTLNVVFSINSVSITKKLNFFIRTFSGNQYEIEEANKKSKKTSSQVINAVSFEYILKEVIDVYSSELIPDKKDKKAKKVKQIKPKDFRCFWVSKETGQIVSDFIPINNKNYINERDIYMKRELRVEIIPEDQIKLMSKINSSILKNKKSNNYCGARIEVYKSYVQTNFDDDDDNDDVRGNDNYLKVFDFPFVLVNVKSGMKVKKLRDLISNALNCSANHDSSENSNIKYDSLFLPQLKNNMIKGDYEEDSEEDDDDVGGIILHPLIKQDYKFAFNGKLVLKNEGDIQLSDNLPNKLFLVYSKDKITGYGSKGVMFY